MSRSGELMVGVLFALTAVTFAEDKPAAKPAAEGGGAPRNAKPNDVS